MNNKYLNLIACALLGCGAAHAAPAPYFITDIGVLELPTPGAADSMALDINDKGEIVGWFKTVNGVKHAFLYRQGLMEDITFGTFSQAEAHGINNYTQVVGIMGAPEEPMVHGFYWDNGAISFLDELAPATCATGAAAHAINDAGLIAGEHLQGCGGLSAHPAKWSNYQSPWKPLFPSYVVSIASAFAHNVNNGIGIIVGDDMQGILGGTGGWYWQYGTIRNIPKTVGPPPEFYYPTLRAFGVSSAYGRIVGEADLLPHGLPPQPGDLVTRAFFWDGVASTSEGLPILGDGKEAGAREIDDQEFIAGWADRWIKPANAFYKRAVVWNQGKITMLPLPAGIDDIFGRVPTVCEAKAVNNMNDAGIVQVVGYCQFAGRTEAMLWTLKTAQVSLASKS
ncbi:MAG TPA: hypothetical protein VGQ27_07825 [Steroidobacteraceae bacterium]|jgi:probable HAF family extracellular repeat protein|nr:hypothetical protein [Steroidobacteraceae bacterium]